MPAGTQPDRLAALELEELPGEHIASGRAAAGPAPDGRRPRTAGRMLSRASGSASPDQSRPLTRTSTTFGGSWPNRPMTGSIPVSVTESRSAVVGGTWTTCVSRQPPAGDPLSHRRLRGRVERAEVVAFLPTATSTPVTRERATPPRRSGDDQHLDRADLGRGEAKVDPFPFSGCGLPPGREVIVDDEPAIAEEIRRRSGRFPPRQPWPRAARRWRCPRSRLSILAVALSR